MIDVDVGPMKAPASNAIRENELEIISFSYGTVLETLMAKRGKIIPCDKPMRATLEIIRYFIGTIYMSSDKQM